MATNPTNGVDGAPTGPGKYPDHLIAPMMYNNTSSRAITLVIDGNRTLTLPPRSTGWHDLGVPARDGIDDAIPELQAEPV